MTHSYGLVSKVESYCCNIFQCLAVGWGSVGGGGVGEAFGDDEAGGGGEDGGDSDNQWRSSR